MQLFLLFVAAFAAVASAGMIGAAPAEPSQKRYDNYKVYSLKLQNVTQLEELQQIFEQENHIAYDIWKEYNAVDKDMHVMIKPEEIQHFSEILAAQKIQAELLVPNVQAVIDAESTSIGRSAEAPFGWDRYYELDEIETWLDSMLKHHPKVTKEFVVGRSYKGRNIRGIKISHKCGNPGIFIESNIHAREWITSATATWLINQLLTSQEEAVRELAENIDWYKVPVFNVDGFEYSHRTDRMWRKTRQPVRHSKCIGIDANRNFDSHWMENGGASANPCSEKYAGPLPFSEPETLGLANYLTEIKNKINIYLAFHSYGQRLLHPYGHSAHETPANHEDLEVVGKAFVDAVKSYTYGTEYVSGATGSVLYIASGSSVDFVFDTLHVKLGYTIDFRDKGRFGFVLPPSQIIPNCEEMLEGLKALIAKAKELSYLFPKCW